MSWMTCNNHYIKCLFTSYGDKKPKETLTSLKWISTCSLTLKLFENWTLIFDEVMSASPLTYGPYANTIKNEKQKERTNSQQVVPIIFCYMFLQPHEDSVQNILTCETVSFTASFPEWSSSGFRRRNNQTFRAKSMFSFQGSLRLIVDPNSSPRGKKCHQNPEKNGQNWLLGKRQRSAVTLFWTFWKLSQVRCK